MTASLALYFTKKNLRSILSLTIHFFTFFYKKLVYKQLALSLKIAKQL